MSSPANLPSEPARRRPITDSPWLWVLVYSSFAIVAMFVLQNKYGRRQAGLERRYQARERIGWTGLEPEAGRGAEAAPEGSGAGASGGGAIANTPAGDGLSGADENGQILDPGERPYSSPQQTQIKLWPIASLLGAIALLGAVMLIRERWRLAAAP